MASKKPEGTGYMALHEAAAGSHGARMRKKLMGKSTWFKSNREKENPEEDATIPTASGGGRKRKAVGGEEIGTKRCRKEQDPKQIITTSVMFVDSIPHGVLCARLQNCEDRIGVLTDWRVKMVAMGGSQLSQQFSNTDPWSGGLVVIERTATLATRGEEKRKKTALEGTYCTRVDVLLARKSRKKSWIVIRRRAVRLTLEKRESMLVRAAEAYMRGPKSIGMMQ